MQEPYVQSKEKAYKISFFQVDKEYMLLYNMLMLFAGFCPKTESGTLMNRANCVHNSMFPGEMNVYRCRLLYEIAYVISYGSSRLSGRKLFEMAEIKKNILTQEGLRKLEAELEELKVET